MWKRLDQRKLTVVLLIAIAARLAALALFREHFAYSEPGGVIHGSVAYDEYALNLLETGVYGRVAGAPDAGLPPLYSAVVAAVYAVFGRQYLAVAALHILFDALSIALLYDICRRLFPRRGQEGDVIGALAGLFFALYPYLIFQNLTLNDTAFWILLLHLFVWLLIRLRERTATDRAAMAIAVLAGLALGISVLARALLPPLALLAALWFMLRLSLRETILRLLPVAVVSLLVPLPWLLRAYDIYGGFVPIALNSGENVFQGNNPYAAAVFRAGYDVQWLAPPLDIPPTDERLRRNAALGEAGWRYLRENPGAVPDLMLVKLLVYWNPQVTPLRNLRQGEKLSVDAAGNIVIITGEGSQLGVTAANAAYQDNSLFNIVGRNLHIIYFGGLWLLAIAGAWLRRREWRMLSLLVFAQVSQTLVYLLFHPSTRYRSPTDPLLFVFSAAAIMWVVERWRGRRVK
ncbi:MAG: glycosyltransferase family 39 protein [Chloroflexota bacterium]|nr:glycosyltransferase family 39 protein [Chloroflexota bacterium]MDE2909731.1 glycosyltransferase family 39 protein [Chloroflexota bacterium]